MGKPNLWQIAILEQLAGGLVLKPAEIWEGMRGAGFQHASRVPRATLGARLAEMVAEERIVRVGPSSYQLRSTAKTKEAA